MYEGDLVIVTKKGPSQFLTPAVSLPLLPRPSKAKMEDLDLPAETVVPLPVLPMVPKSKGILSMDEKMQLWTLVAFFQDFGVAILRIKAHQVPDLGTCNVYSFSGSSDFKQNKKQNSWNPWFVILPRNTKTCSLYTGHSTHISSAPKQTR
jgi:hypothetical protein